MKCFITGITGFIGMNLARELATNGHQVNAIIRGQAPADLEEMIGFHFYKGDLHNTSILEEAMQGCELVFHLAAYAKPWAKDPSTYYKINVEGARNVFEAALKKGVEKVVFTSSAATMSPSDDKRPVDESALRTLQYFNAYEFTKAEAEKHAQDYCKKGLHVVIVNPSRIYGPGPLNPSNSLTKIIAKYQKGNWHIIPGDGKKIGNYVFIDDVVHGHVLAGQKGRAGERYILGGDNMTFDEFFQILAKITGNHRHLYHLPVKMMVLGARLMEIQNPITGIPPAITVDFVRKYMNHWCLSSEKAIMELGYKITSFEEGVKKTLEWLNTSNNIRKK